MEVIDLYREIMKKLNIWKNKPDNDRSPLIIQGARQVGKTYVMQKFGEENFENYVYINFEDSQDLYDIFDETLDPKKIIDYLSIYSSKPIIPGKTLIIFDEIQSVPRALTSLKYFNEKAPEYHICCAGSLLGIHLKPGTSFPVGKVEFLDLHPMSFKEFIIANKFERYIDYLEGLSIDELNNIPNIDDLKYLLRIYFYVGGMPKPVQVWIDTKDFSKVKEEHNKIVQSYLNDFSKYSDYATCLKIRQVWNSIPEQLSKENSSKFVFGLVKKGSRAKDYELAIQWLVDAALLKKVNAVQTAKLPLSAYAEMDIFKLYCLDIGLLSYLSDIDSRLILSSDKLFNEYNGALTEQFIMQELRELGTTFYWTEKNYEVDFIIQQYNKIIPIEVKAGTVVKTKSLDYYNKKYSPELRIKSSLRGFDYNSGVLNLPLYMFWLLPSLLKSLIEIDDFEDEKLKQFIKEMNIKFT